MPERRRRYSHLHLTRDIYCSPRRKENSGSGENEKMITIQIDDSPVSPNNDRLNSILAKLTGARKII